MSDFFFASGEARLHQRFTKRLWIYDALQRVSSGLYRNHQKQQKGQKGRLVVRRGKKQRHLSHTLRHYGHYDFDGLDVDRGSNVRWIRATNNFWHVPSPRGIDNGASDLIRRAQTRQIYREIQRRVSRCNLRVVALTSMPSATSPISSATEGETETGRSGTGLNYASCANTSIWPARARIYTCMLCCLSCTT